MTHREMKQDDLVTVIEKASAYVSRNPENVRNVGLAAGAVLVVAIGLYMWQSSRATGAAEMLRVAEAKLSTPVAETGANPSSTAPSYPSEAERDRAAFEAFTQLANQYGGRSEGRLARYYRGILLARLGRDDEAETALNEFLKGSKAPLLRALARAQLAQIDARHGKLEEAAKIYSELAEEKAAPYPRDWALFYLADVLEKQGKKPEATAAYQKLTTEFPNSSLAAEVTRMQGGKKATGP